MGFHYVLTVSSKTCSVILRMLITPWIQKRRHFYLQVFFLINQWVGSSEKMKLSPCESRRHFFRELFKEFGSPLSSPLGSLEWFTFFVSYGSETV